MKTAPARVDKIYISRQFANLITHPDGDVCLHIVSNTPERDIQRGKRSEWDISGDAFLKYESNHAKEYFGLSDNEYEHITKEIQNKKHELSK